MIFKNIINVSKGWFTDDISGHVINRGYEVQFFNFSLIFSTNTKTCDETIMLNEIENVLLESHLGSSYFLK